MDSIIRYWLIRLCTSTTLCAKLFIALVLDFNVFYCMIWIIHLFCKTVWKQIASKENKCMRNENIKLICEDPHRQACDEYLFYYSAIKLFDIWSSKKKKHVKKTARRYYPRLHKLSSLSTTQSVAATVQCMYCRVICHLQNHIKNCRQAKYITLQNTFLELCNLIYPFHDRVWFFFAVLLVLSSTSVLSTKLVTKQQFWENTTCRQRFCFGDMIIFWKGKDTFKKQKKSKNRPSNRLDWLQKAYCQASVAACLTLSPPLFSYPASPDDPDCVTRSLGRNILHLFPDHCFVDNCRCRDIWPNMSTKKSVLDNGTNFYCSFFDEFVMKSWKIFCSLSITNRVNTNSINYAITICNRSWGALITVLIIHLVAIWIIILSIDGFTNFMHLHVGCSWQPESLSVICPT